MARTKEELVQGRTETLGQGLTFGYSDELGAGLQSALAALSGGDASETYDTALKENRGIYDRAQADEPVASKVIEAVGSIPTAVVPVGGAARGAGLASKLFSMAKAAAPLGALSGAGHSKAEAGSAELAGDVVTGAGTAAALAPAVGALGMGAANLAGRVPFIRQMAQRIRAEQSASQAPEYERLLFAEGTAADPAISASVRNARLKPAVQQWNAIGDDFIEGVVDKGGLPNHDIIHPKTGSLRVPSKEWGDPAGYNPSLDAAYGGKALEPGGSPGQTARYYDPSVKELKDMLTRMSDRAKKPAGPRGPSDTVASRRRSEP
jgi:hypothetical protein